MKCFACGTDKDLTVKAVYPYEGDCLDTDHPMPQLLVILCEPKEKAVHKIGDEILIQIVGAPNKHLAKVVDFSPGGAVLEVPGWPRRLMPAGDYKEDSAKFRTAVICHECWHRLESNGGIDLWIGQECWESLKPVIPFERLPFELPYDPGNQDKWKAENYMPFAPSEWAQPTKEFLERNQGWNR